MASYLRILRTPRVAGLIGAVLLGRLPFAINALAVLLYVREITGSFAGAGIVSGALALGSAAGAPLQGRLVDRRGEGTLMLLALVHASALLALWGLGAAGAQVPVLASVALLAGAAFSPTGAVLRTRFPQLLRDREELVTAAYALDSVMIEVAFVTGPLLTAAGIALAGPEAMLGVSAAFNLIGTAIFVVLLPPAPAAFRDRDESASGLLGALTAPGIRTMALASIPAGFCVGTIEVGLPAFSSSHGGAELAGVLLAMWSLGSGVGGLVYGARRRRLSLVDVHTRLAFLLPLANLPLLAAGAPVSMAILVLFAGIPLAPLIASRNEIISRVAPGGAATEAFTWLTTALAGGLSVGVAAGGLIVDAGGWVPAMGAGIAMGTVGALLVLARRDSVAGAVMAPAPA